MDLFLWIVVAVSQVLIGLLGVVAIKSDFASEHFKEFVAAFVVLSLVGMAAAGYSAVRASKFSDMVARLTKQILFEVKGSPDSYLELHPFFLGEDSEKGIVNFNIENRSGYPMIDVSMGVVGRMGIEKVPQPDSRLGDIHPGRSYRLPYTLQLDKDSDNYIEYAIQSRSVTLWQKIVFSWTGKNWAVDYDLYKEVDGETIYIRKIREDFPYIRNRNRADAKAMEQKEKSKQGEG